MTAPQPAPVLRWTVDPKRVARRARIAEIGLGIGLAIMAATVALVVEARGQVIDANGNLATVRSASGKTAKVGVRWQTQFQGLIDDLEAEGYRIEFMGGWRKWGTCRKCDAHPKGRALDINQTARNRVTRRFPSDVTRIAARHGLCHGAIWGNADRGHFEVADASRSTKCRAVARKGWPRIVEQEKEFKTP